MLPCLVPVLFAGYSEVANGYVMQSGVLLQDSSSYIKENCVNCTLINGIYQEVLMELKSLRLITNILQEEIKTLRNQHEDKEALRNAAFGRCKNKKVSEVQCSSAMSEQQVTRESTVPQWSEVAAGRRKILPHTR